MADFEYKFVDQLIRESTLAVRYYFLATCFLWSIALTIILVSLFKPPLEPVKEMVSGIVAIFGVVPAPLGLGARSQRVGLISLKDRWVDAEARKDRETLERLRPQFQELENDVIRKGLSLGK